MDERERSLAELEFLEHHSGGRKPTAAHPLCRCVELAGEGGVVRRGIIRRECPVHGKAAVS